jgi:hypothetical protein
MTDPGAGPLADAVLEVERHVAAGGWDQPPRLYALAETADLVRREPRLAASLAVGPGEAGSLTPIEQEEVPDAASVEELLAGLGWPPGVAGAAIVVERMMLPPEHEEELAELPRDETAALAWLADHPQRQDVRLAVGVLRDGSRHCAVRLRMHDTDDSVLTGPGLVPGLADALAATLVE